MEKITKRQQELLTFLIETIRENGLPPTISEIATALGLKSKNSVFKLLKSLEDRGFIKRDSSARGIKIKEQEGISLQKGFINLPLVGQVAAGTPILAEENIEDWINLPARFVKNRKDAFLLKVLGESMKGAGIFDQDMVIVKKTADVNLGDIVVALLEDGATVKRLVKKGERYFLKAENPRFKDIYPEAGTICGKVIGVIRQLE